MRGMILAAGRGSRMGNLTDDTPKPLLRIGQHYLIEYSILAMAKAAISEIVINVSYHREQIKAALGNGDRYGVAIHYSEEEERLETGGGILKALPLLGDAPFVVVSSDIISDYAFNQLPEHPQGMAHLVLVDNPLFHPQGDFCLDENKVYSGDSSTLTFSNIGVYRPELFSECKPGHFPLGPLLRQAVQRQQVSGEYFAGRWFNVGDIDQLKQVCLESLIADAVDNSAVPSS